MSEFVEKLERISGASAQPMGFAAAATRTKSPPMLLITSLPENNLELISLAAESGADALIISIAEVTPSTPGEIAPASLKIPWGVSVAVVTGEGANLLAEAGCDFVVFSAASPAVSHTSGIGRSKISSSTGSRTLAVIEASDI